MYLNYQDVNNSYAWVMSQKLHGDGFKWVENTSKSHNKNEYAIHIRNLKEALNHQLLLTKIH